jgi:hypothetical protein
MTPAAYDADEMLHDAVYRVSAVSAELFEDPAFARRNLDSKVELGFFECADLSAVAPTRIELLQVYQPGSQVDCASLSGELHRRWQSINASTIRIYWATRKTVQLLGGWMPGRRPPLDAATHDLGVSAVALSLFGTSETFRQAWIPEEWFTDVHGQAKPDAALAGKNGLSCFVEFAGLYKQERLARLGQLADALGVPLHLYTIDPARG